MECPETSIPFKFEIEVRGRVRIYLKIINKELIYIDFQ